MKVNKIKKEKINFSNVEKPIVKSTSLWRVFSFFAIISLIAVNIINYWQPVNHNNLKSIYEYQQKSILSAYELRDSYNSFKYHPDETAFNLIQKMIILNNHVNAMKELALDFDPKYLDLLNINVEKITHEIPSIKSFQESIDKLYRTIKKIKYDVASNVNIVNNDKYYKSFYPITVKIEELIQQLKYESWSSNINVNTIQEEIEDLSLEIEQIKGNKTVEDLVFQNIVTSLENIFNDITLLMPSILKLSVVNTELVAANNNQVQLVKSIKDYKTHYINKINDQSLIIFTIILTNILLFLIVFLAKTSEKVKVIYNNYKVNQDVYLLGHDSDEKKSVSQLEEKVQEDNRILAAVHDNHNKKRVDQLLLERTNLNLVVEQVLDKKNTLLKDCYMLLNILEQATNDHTKDEKISFQSVVTIHKIAYQIMDKALLLENYINKLAYKSQEVSGVATAEILD